MHIHEKSLDDLMHEVFRLILGTKKLVRSSRGPNYEEVGVLLELTHPRSRISRTEMRGRVFSALGELLWILSGSNSLKYIEYYISAYKKESDDGKTVYGGYGPRIFHKSKNNNQIINIIKTLKDKPWSKRAVVQIFDAKDIRGRKRRAEIPCTCTMQFLIRNKRLVMFVAMRSNDAYIGLPHDIFAFTMLHELIARSLGVQAGRYLHAVGSLHIYKADSEKAMKYINEGYQPSVSMPPMPMGDPWRHVAALLEIEKKIRRGSNVDRLVEGLPDYWADMARLLQIFKATKDKDPKRIKEIKKAMSTKIFDQYIDVKGHKANAVVQESIAFDKKPE